MSFYRWDAADLILSLRVQPRAGRAGLGEPHGDELKVRLQAPPVDGRANDELIALVAAACGVGRGEVTLLRGAHSRSKQVRVHAPKRLPALVEPAP